MLKAPRLFITKEHNSRIAIPHTNTGAIHRAPGSGRRSAHVALVVGRCSATRRLVAVDAREVADAAEIRDWRRDPRVGQRRRVGRVAVAGVH